MPPDPPRWACLRAHCADSFHLPPLEQNPEINPEAHSHFSNAAVCNIENMGVAWGQGYVPPYLTYALFTRPK